jgi:hypothetical protein
MSGTLQELLERIYGIKTYYRINERADSVGTSVSQILSANPNRVSFLVVNLSTTNLFISPKNDVTCYKGLFVAPNGGSVILQWDVDFELVSQAWYAIASASSTNVYILENIII